MKTINDSYLNYAKKLITIAKILENKNYYYESDKIINNSIRIAQNFNLKDIASPIVDPIQSLMQQGMKFYEQKMLEIEQYNRFQKIIEHAKRIESGIYKGKGDWKTGADFIKSAIDNLTPEEKKLFINKYSKEINEINNKIVGLGDLKKYQYK